MVKGVPVHIARTTFSLISGVGVILLLGILWDAARGVLAEELFPGLPHGRMSTVYALALSLPVPFHVISIGLVLQKRWLSPRLARASWVAIVVSGCWLGAALAVKMLLLPAS